MSIILCGVAIVVILGAAVVGGALIYRKNSAKIESTAKKIDEIGDGFKKL